MPPPNKRPSYPNQLNEHNPTLSPDISPVSVYSFLPDADLDDSPYTNLPRFAAHSSEPQPYARYEKTSPGFVPPNYPESSQRTLIHDGPYSAGYDSGADDRYADTRDAHAGSSAMYENFMGPSLDQITSATRKPPVIRRPSVTERPDMYLYPLGPSGTSPLPPQPGPNKFMFPEETPYSDTDSGSHAGSPPLPSSLGPRGSRLPQASQFQMSRRSPNQFDAPFALSPGDGSEHQSYLHSSAHTSQFSNTTTHPISMSSIPMRNSSGEWLSAPPSSATVAHSPPQIPSRKVLKRSSARMTPDSDSSTSIGRSGSHVGQLTPDTLPSLSSATSSSNPPTRRKKSKMHECEVCGKQFPRPSGLQTHMNTHNNVKRWLATAFSCGFPGCPRTFTVRSNATRHLRTHGVIPSPADPPPAPYVVDFNTPTVMPSLLPGHEMMKAPYKLRWMPPSLTTRTNAKTLASMSDAENDSDDAMETTETNVDWRSALSIPLHPVIPSSYTCDNDAFEERNSYLDTKPYPYHPSQYTVLPGPAVRRSTSASRSVV